ncbi:MAG: signal peptidase I [Mobilitalea sp.]
MKKKIWMEIISWILIFAVAYGSAMLINRFIIYRVSSPTASMENTFMIGEKVVTYRLAYLFSDPIRGDIVVFEYPDNPEEDFIKRIIGLPGETVKGIEGVVYINGEPLKEDYFKEKPEGDFGPFIVPEGHYFMMGDNRNISLDARYWENKYVAKEKIRGKALMKYPDFDWFNKIKY